ncbi:MAG: DUF3857 domain-containing protein [Ferruginibacter sp.]
MKNIKFFLAMFCLFILLQARAGDPEYPVNKIPAALLKNANVVKRFEEYRFDVINTGKARMYHKVAITVLNEKGDKYAAYHEDYDKLHSIESIQGRLFDETGKKIRTLKKSEVQDISGTSEGSLAEDNRIKQFNFYHKLYPYTVEYETEILYNYTLFYPVWVPQEEEFYAVEYSRISISSPEDMSFRYKAFNYPAQPALTTEKHTKISTWEVKNLTAIEDEFASPYWPEMTTSVFFAPVQFQVESYEGNMATWQDYGKFVYALKNNRDQLPDNVKTMVHSLSDGITDTKRKIEVLYDFLQKNTRYISIQLGIGGWQPFDAKYVAANRYGDCKALSNYMYSLLKEAGIKSFYTLVKAGVNNRFFLPDFPSSQFNHVILCVPTQKDTVWLECTSQTVNAGYLGSFTSDRNVLLVDNNGGILIKTPRYDLEQNLQVRKTIATIDEEGNLLADIVTDYKAVQQDELHGLINSLSKDKLMEYLKNEIDLPTYDVIKFDYKETKNNIPAIKESLTIKATNYAQVSGSRLFIVPNILTCTHSKLMANDSRMFDVVLNSEYRDIDTVEIKIPAGYTPESILQTVKLDTKFGRYSISASVQGDKIVYYRSREQARGRFPAIEWNEMVKFYEQVYKADRNRIVLVKK